MAAGPRGAAGAAPPPPNWAHTSPQTLDAAPRLHVWQMDASAAFLDLRDRYRDRIDAVFDSLMGRSLDMAHDRAILRDLLSLAPPGIDELYALASLGDAFEERRYAVIIVDPAPTGHLLRLLDLPAIAIEWSHRLMRLILKYKEIAELGEAAQDLLNFTRRTRALDTMLHDAARAGVVLVSLDEPAVRDETVRLQEALRSTGIAIIGEVKNRGGTTATGSQWTVLAPASPKPLVGIAAIRNWSRDWRRSVES
jgi:arsenite-transporting ATPase